MEVALGGSPVLSLHQLHDDTTQGCQGAVDADGLPEVLPSSSAGLVPLTACDSQQASVHTVRLDALVLRLMDLVGPCSVQAGLRESSCDVLLAGELQACLMTGPCRMGKRVVAAADAAFTQDTRMIKFLQLFVQLLQCAKPSCMKGVRGIQVKQA